MFEFTEVSTLSTIPTTTEMTSEHPSIANITVAPTVFTTTMPPSTDVDPFSTQATTVASESPSTTAITITFPVYEVTEVTTPYTIPTTAEVTSENPSTANISTVATAFTSTEPSSTTASRITILTTATTSESPTTEATTTASSMSETSDVSTSSTIPTTLETTTENPSTTSVTTAPTVLVTTPTFSRFAGPFSTLKKTASESSSTTVTTSASSVFETTQASTPFTLIPTIDVTSEKPSTAETLTVLTVNTTTMSPPTTTANSPTYALNPNTDTTVKIISSVYSPTEGRTSPTKFAPTTHPHNTKMTMSEMDTAATVLSTREAVSTLSYKTTITVDPQISGSAEMQPNGMPVTMTATKIPQTFFTSSVTKPTISYMDTSTHAQPGKESPNTGTDHLPTKFPFSSTATQKATDPVQQPTYVRPQPPSLPRESTVPFLSSRVSFYSSTIVVPQEPREASTQLPKYIPPRLPQVDTAAPAATHTDYATSRMKPATVPGNLLPPYLRPQITTEIHVPVTLFPPKYTSYRTNVPSKTGSSNSLHAITTVPAISEQQTATSTRPPYIRPRDPKLTESSNLPPNAAPGVPATRPSAITPNEHYPPYVKPLSTMDDKGQSVAFENPERRTMPFTRPDFRTLISESPRLVTSYPTARPAYIPPVTVSVTEPEPTEIPNYVMTAAPRTARPLTEDGFPLYTSPQWLKEGSVFSHSTWQHSQPRVSTTAPPPTRQVFTTTSRKPELRTAHPSSTMSPLVPYVPPDTSTRPPGLDKRDQEFQLEGDYVSPSVPSPNNPETGRFFYNFVDL
ncbi:hypothetical protein HPB48_005078 [Haemaphysalis longicornis]|uniref:Uncharacterized protein n=1 Tax=Haemaphysalis longicornis TaxID=44386 RepID=A0A9J6FHC7_HAELO|nr:hypothetical protein HPB48_005078 [Haemaphysalis longicornis]